MKIDGVFYGDDQIAFEMCNYLLRHEGMFVGGSSGLNIVGAVWLAKKLGPGHTIVTVIADSGVGYISKIFNPEWRKEKNIELKRDTAEQFCNSFDPSKVLSL